MFYFLDTANGWKKRGRKVKIDAFPIGYVNTESLCEDTFIFHQNDTDSMDSSVLNIYHNYASRMILLSKYLKECCQIDDSGFICKEKPFIRRVNNYNDASNKVVDKGYNTIFKRLCVYGHISIAKHKVFKVLDDAVLSADLKTDLKITTACLLIHYYGQCQDPFIHFPYIQEEVKKEIARLNHMYLLLPIDPLFNDNFYNEKILIEFCMNNPFITVCNTIIPSYRFAPKKSPIDKIFDCMFMFNMLFNCKIIITRTN